MPGSDSGRSPPYTPDERLHGNSRFSGLRLFRLALDGLTAFTTCRCAWSAWPAWSWPQGLCYAAYLVGNICCWATRSPAGPPSSLPCFFAGINLISWEWWANMSPAFSMRSRAALCCRAPQTGVRLQRRGDELMAKIMQQPAAPNGRRRMVLACHWRMAGRSDLVPAVDAARRRALRGRGRDMLRAGSHGARCWTACPISTSRRCTTGCLNSSSRCSGRIRGWPDCRPGWPPGHVDRAVFLRAAPSRPRHRDHDHADPGLHAVLLRRRSSPTWTCWWPA